MYVWLFTTLWTVACQAALCSWESLGENSGVDCHALLQRIFPTPHLLGHLHWQAGSNIFKITCVTPPSPPGMLILKVRGNDKICYVT